MNNNPLTITSKNTSVNTTQIPYIFKHIDFEEMKKRWGKITVFDYGCGRKTDHIQEFLAQMDVDYVGYDPHWGDGLIVYNKRHGFSFAIEKELWIDEHMPVLVCSNVLNVISDLSNVWLTKHWLQSFTPAPYFIKTYAGNKSGIGGESKPDCWQWNQPTKYYVEVDRHEVVKKQIIIHQDYTQFIK